MTQQKKASFGLRKFTVPNFSYNKARKEKSELDLLIEPRGEYDSSTGRYFLELNLQGLENDDRSQIIQVISIAEFRFSEKMEITDIPEYFYANAIAIMFPYVRAFISNLTLQANTGIIMLETLNLSGLKEVLKEKTTIAPEN